MADRNSLGEGRSDDRARYPGPGVAWVVLGSEGEEEERGRGRSPARYQQSFATSSDCVPRSSHDRGTSRPCHGFRHSRNGLPVKKVFWHHSANPILFDSFFHAKKGEF